MAARSNAWVCGRSVAGIAGSNTAGGMYVSSECRVLSDKTLCDWPIPRPEECGESECDVERSTKGPGTSRAAASQQQQQQQQQQKEFSMHFPMCCLGTP